MAYDFSSRKHPGTDVVQTTGVVKLNNFVDDVETAANELLNMIETHADALTICTSTTRPDAPTLGELIVETDTERIYRCDNATGPVWVEMANLYYKDVAGTDELHVKTPNDTEIQLTSEGGLNVVIPEAVNLGQIEGLTVEYLDADTLSISAGWCHLKDSGNDTYLVQIVVDTALDVQGLAGEGVGYVFIDGTGALSWSLVPPTKNSAKGGYYDASGDLRFIGGWAFDSGSLIDGWIANGWVVHNRENREAYTYNGFTVHDFSALCPSIAGAQAVVSTHVGGAATHILMRPTGSLSTGTRWTYGITGNQLAFPVLDSSATHEIDTKNGNYSIFTIGYICPR